MSKILDKLADLVDVKSAVTFVIIVVFAILALRGSVNPDAVMHVVTTVIAFYFGTQHEKKKGGSTQ